MAYQQHGSCTRSPGKLLHLPHSALDTTVAETTKVSNLATARIFLQSAICANGLVVAAEAEILDFRGVDQYSLSPCIIICR